MRPEQSKQIARGLTVGFIANGSARPKVVETIIGLSSEDKRQVIDGSKAIVSRVKNPTGAQTARLELAEEVIMREPFDPTIVRQTLLGLPQISSE